MKTASLLCSLILLVLESTSFASGMSCQDRLAGKKIEVKPAPVILVEGWKPYRRTKIFKDLLIEKRSVIHAIDEIEKKIKSGVKAPKATGYLSVLLAASEPEKNAAVELTPEEKSKLESELNLSKSRLKELNGQIESQKQVDKTKLLKTLAAASHEKAARTLLEDALATVAITRLPRHHIVSLAVGSATSEPTAQQKEELASAVSELTKRGYFIVYDGETKLSGVIHAAAGERGLGLLSRGGGPSPKGTVVITNDYMRMAVLKHAHQTIVSLDSLSGAALLMTVNGWQVLVWNEGGRLDSSYNDWVSKLTETKRNLGVSLVTGRNYDRLSDVLNLKIKHEEREEDLLPFHKVESEISLPTKLESFSYETLVEASNYVETTLRAVRKDRSVGGAVIFGSSGFDAASVQLTYDTSYALGSMGVPVVTGGAGGTMYVANKGAHDAGGISIGVPMTNKSLVSNEDETSSDVQTLTIDTPSYEVRIPTLLHGRPLIIFAPGGRGTIQELAVALMATQKAEAGQTKQSHYAFLDRSYYGELVDWLKKQNLPHAFLNRLHVVDDVGQLRHLANKMTAEGEKTLATQAVPEERKAHTPFEIPKPEADDNQGGDPE